MTTADALPFGAIDYCLTSTGAGWEDIGYIAYSYDPDLGNVAPTDRYDVQDGGAVWRPWRHVMIVPWPTA